MRPVPAPDGWCSPSELAEYAFCPRAHFYHRQAPAPRTPASAAGERYHEATLSGELWRDRHRRTAWAAVGLGLLLLGLGALVLLR